MGESEQRMKRPANIHNKFIAANLHVKITYPDSWGEKMRPYRLLIGDDRIEWTIDESAILLADRYGKNENAKMWIYATAQEMINEWVVNSRTA